MPASTPRVPRKVLIYRLGSLGDTLVALPALRLVARAFPDAERRMLTNYPVASKAPPAAAILEHTGLVSGFMRYTVGTRNPFALLKLWWQLVWWRPDVLVYMGSKRGVASAKRDAMFFRLCGISWQMGVPVTEDMQRSRVLGETPEYTVVDSEASRLALNLAELGDARLEMPESWSLNLTEGERARAVEVLRPVEGRTLLAVSVGAKTQLNDWGRDNWRALLAHLGGLFPDYALVLCGAAGEVEPSEYAAEGWRSAGAGPVVNLCGVLAPRESAAVFACAKAFLGHDSGPMHLAASVGTPCVAVFSARNTPREWFPFGNQHRVIYHHVDCAGCGLLLCFEQKKKCILSITVDEVLTEAVSLLSTPSEVIEVR